MTRRVRKASLWPWLTAAALLHGFLSLLPPKQPIAAKPPALADAKLEQNQLEVVLLDQSSPVTVVVPAKAEQPLPPSLVKDNPARDHGASDRESAAPTLDSSRSNSEQPTSEGGRALGTGHSLEAGRSPERVRSPATAAELGGEGAAKVKESASSATQVGDTAVPNGSTPTVDRAPPPQRVAPRSLAELGYGAPHPAAIAPYLGVDAKASAQNRLDQNMAQAIIDSDRDRSNGIEGPVTKALHIAAMAVVVPTSLSKISVIIGSNGKLADFHIVSTNQDARALANLSERLKKLLANETVRVPNGRAVEFTYEIKSAVLLPSGRGPGLGVEVLGIPLKEGRADNSSKISILTPKLKFGPVSEPDPERNGKVTQTLPQLTVGISVLGLDGDMVDVGANERQVVHTRLVRQRVL